VERIRKGAMEKLALAPQASQKIFNMAFNLKRKMLAYGIYSVSGVDAVFSQFRKMVGGRLRLLGMRCHGYHIDWNSIWWSSDIRRDADIFENLISCNCLQGYGLTSP
jgi:long-subunit acyl-CoA synthetase (AMP-forming)